MKNYQGAALRGQWLNKHRSSLFMTIYSFAVVAIVMAVIAIVPTLGGK